MPDIRWIELDGVVNMRDVGGLPTTDGAAIRPGRLIRSDNLQDLSPQDVSHLLDVLGVSDIVDLRTYVEVAKEGDGPLRARPDVTIHHFTLYPEDSTEGGIPAGDRDLPWVAARERAADNPEPRPGARRGHDDYWTEHYLGYLALRPDSVVAALRAIAGSTGAVVVHCAAGKDRTGTIVGLALKLAGATDEAIVADFAASAQRVPQILERLRLRPAYAENLRDKTVEDQSPRADTMRLLLAALGSRPGGVEGWLEGHGWTRQDTEALRRQLRD